MSKKDKNLFKTCPGIRRMFTCINAIWRQDGDVARTALSIVGDGGGTWRQTRFGREGRGWCTENTGARSRSSQPARSEIISNQYYSKCCCQEARASVDEERVKNGSDGREGGQTTSAGLSAPAHEAVRHLGSRPDTVQLRSKVRRPPDRDLSRERCVVWCTRHTIDSKSGAHRFQVQTEPFFTNAGPQDVSVRPLIAFDGLLTAI
jgi:hypothetical protein